MYDTIIARGGHSGRLRNACRAASAALTVLVSCICAQAQGTYANGLSADSVDPAADARFIAKTRARMDEIRRTEHRPTVALVLSGGGAKGAAEAGAIRYLEEQGIPIDLVCGTSIGGMIGGMLAVGYSSDDVREIFQTQDWSFTLTDKVPQERIPYANKLYNKNYLISIPFDIQDYDESVFESQGAMRTKASFAALTKSLPSGYAYGLNVNNLISSLTVGYQDTQYFSSFPVPFVSVSADIVSGKAKNWGYGSIQDAMRSTMSIPGLFDPLRIDDMVLVDGGARNNFPTDLAKAMGADYIIGIDLSDIKKQPDEVANLGNIMMEFISMLGIDSFNKNMGTPDIIIKPDIAEYNMLSFNREAIDTMLARGYRAATDKASEISEIRSKTGTVKKLSGRPAATNLAKKKAIVKSIEYRGVSKNDAMMLEKLTGLQPGDTLGKEEMDHAMSVMQATGVFDNIRYSFYGSGEPYSLVFDCVSSASSRLGLGFRMDTEEWASIKMSLGFGTRKLAGPRIEIETKLGQNFELNAYSSYASPFLPTINFDLQAARYKGDLSGRLFSDDDSHGISYWTRKAMLYFSDIRWVKTNFKAGIRLQNYELNGSNYMGIPSSEIPKERTKGNYIGAFASEHIYTFDAPYYPAKGIDLCFSADYDFAKPGSKDFHPILYANFDFKGVIPAGSRFAIIPEVHFSSFFGNSATDDPVGKVSAIHTNFIGGSMSKRYTDHQIPFFAVNNVMIAKDILLSAAVEARFNPVGKFYLSAMGGAFNTKDTVMQMIGSPVPHIWGIGAEAGYDTIIGPVKINVHWSNQTQWGAYLSMGYDF